MGAAVSYNSVKAITKSVADISSQITTNQKITTDINQIISVTHVKGDVYIKGTVMRQQINVNLGAVMKAIANQDAQQKIANDLAQEAKSVVSGINLGQYSSATNMINMFVDVSTRIVNTMLLNCDAKIQANQTIMIDDVQGNVTIVDSVFDIMVDALLQCTQDAAASNSSLQDIENKIKQIASSKAQGVELWQVLAVIAAGLILFPAVTGRMLGRRAIIGIMMMIVGSAVVAAGLVRSNMCQNTSDIKSRVAMVPHAPIPDSTSMSQLLYKTEDVALTDAVLALKPNQVCFWQKYSMDSNTFEPTLAAKPIAFYFPVNAYDPNENVQHNPLVRVNLKNTTDDKDTPKDSNIVDGAKPGDTYLNSKSGQYFVLTDDKGWESRGFIKELDARLDAKDNGKYGWAHTAPPAVDYQVWVRFRDNATLLNHDVFYRDPVKTGFWKKVDGVQLKVDGVWLPPLPNAAAVLRDTYVAGVNMNCYGDKNINNILYGIGGVLIASGLVILLKAGLEKQSSTESSKTKINVQ